MKPRRSLPFLKQYTDRQGRTVNQYRRAGRLIRLPDGRGFTPEFMDAYRAAETEILAAAAPLGAGQARVGSINWAIEGVRASRTFCDLSAKAQADYHRAFAVLRERIGPHLVRALQPGHVDVLLDEAAGRGPGPANELLKTIRAVVRFAIKHRQCTSDPTAGQHKRKSVVRAVYNHTWTDLEIEQYRAAHAIGTTARLALEAMLNTGLRRSDAARLGRQHLSRGEDGQLWLAIGQQKKKGALIRQPIVAPELLACLAAAPKDDLLPFLRTRQGRPFTSATLGDAFEIWAREAGLPDCCRAHGLRRGLARRAAEAGADPWQLAAILGDTVAVATDYTRDRNTTALAAAGITRLVTKTKTATV